MKKRIVALALITGLTVATVASANWGRGNRGYGGGYGGCQQLQGRVLPQVDQQTQDKINQFFKDTQPLHREIAMKRAEKRALMVSGTPDPQAVSKVTGELFDLRTTIREKAELAGVDQYVGPGNNARMGKMGKMGRMGRMGQMVGMSRMGGMGCGPCNDMGPGFGQLPVEPQQ